MMHGHVLKLSLVPLNGPLLNLRLAFSLALECTAAFSFIEGLSLSNYALLRLYN